MTGGYGTGLYGEGLYGIGASPGSGPLALHALCEDLLAASVEALDTIPAADPDLLGAPDRQFISPGQPALDCCDQLTVYAAAITHANVPGSSPVGRRNVTGAVNLVGLQVTITRCVPVAQPGTYLPEAPSAESIQAAAEQTNADAWALWNHLWNLWLAGLLFSMCGEVYWDGMAALPISGGCGGWRLSIRVSLDGYNETETS